MEQFDGHKDHPCIPLKEAATQFSQSLKLQLDFVLAKKDEMKKVAKILSESIECLKTVFTHTF